MCPNSVAGLPRRVRFRLRVNHKKLTRSRDPGRDAQVAYNTGQKEQFAAHGWPIVSVDANTGSWSALRQPRHRLDPPAPRRQRLRLPLRSRGDRHSLRHERHRRQPRVGVRGHLPQHASLRRRQPHRIVVPRRPTPLPPRPPSPRRRRRRRQQRSQSPRLETRPPTPTLRPSRPHRLPLSLRRLQKEPGRAPALQPDQRELGWAPLDSHKTILNYLRTTTAATGLQVRNRCWCHQWAIRSGIGRGPKWAFNPAFITPADEATQAVLATAPAGVAIESLMLQRSLIVPVPGGSERTI